MKKLLLIDTFNFLHRAYHALPLSFRDENGEPTNAVYGVTSMLINTFDFIKPDYVLAALDGMEPTFRSEEFTGYKAHRKPMEDDLSSQIPKVIEILGAFGIKTVVVNGYEADDIIGTMVARFSDECEVIIVSNDRDMWQLVKDNVMYMVPANGKKTADWMGKREVAARLGFDPSLLPDYKGLRGDPSDNIPGVYGIGEKTAKDLIAKFGAIEDIYKNIDKVEPASLKEKLLNNYEIALQSKQLGKIITEVPFQVEISECKYNVINKIQVGEVLKKYNFKSLIRRLGLEPETGEKKKSNDVAPDQLGLF